MTDRHDSDTVTRHQSRSIEDYPFDPLLRPDHVTGLDRLRCIADRGYAATLYDIYLLAERNEMDAQREHRRLSEAVERARQVRDRLRALARRALAGALGSEAQELASHIISKPSGNVSDDDRALAELGRALAELGIV